MTAQTKSSTPFLLFLITGVIIGGTLGILYQQNFQSSLIYIWLGLYGLFFLLALGNSEIPPTPFLKKEGKHTLPRLLITTAVISFLASIPFIWQMQTSHFFYFSSMLLCVINAYALNAFHINYQTNRFHFNYSTLFSAVWDTLAKLMITFFFMILCWAILQLCASLFALLNLTFLKTLISKASFDIACTGFFVSMGLFITTQTQHIIQQIRVILLLICRYLLIPLSLIGIIFVITSLIVFTQQHVTLNQTLLLSVAFLCVTFVNGTYQDANINQLPRFLLKLIKLFLWITPIFTLLALYALIFQGNNNIAGHGINVGNFVYLITILLLLTYNIAYAIIALKQQSWLMGIEKTNIVLTIMAIFITLITTNPLVLNKLPIPKNDWRFQKQASASQQVANLNAQFTAAGFAWKPFENGVLPTDALVVGYDQKPIYFCRVKNNHQYVGGTIKDNQCDVISQQQAKNPAEVLSGPANKANWSTSYYYFSSPAQPALVIVNTTNSPLSVCRAIYNNHIVVGIGDNHGNCTFMMNKKIISSQQMKLVPQFLHVGQ